jgi:hypothetical protein
MDERRARHFWESALREIQDDGFFAPVQTAEPPRPVLPRPKRKRRRLSNLHLVLIVVALSLTLAFIIVNWLAPAFI